MHRRSVSNCWNFCASVCLTLGIAASEVHAAAPATAVLDPLTTSLSAPARVAADAFANLLVAEPADGKVVVFDPFGRVSSVHTNFATPLALAVDAAGKIYVGDSGNGSVSVYDASWNFIRKLGGGNGQFALPNFIAFDPTPGSNTTYVSDSSADQIQVFYNGEFAFAFGSSGTGNGQFSFPAGLHVTTNEVFVVDQNNGRMQVFTRAGVFLRAFNVAFSSGSFGATLTGRCQGMTADSSGRLYIADAFQGSLRVFDPSGTSLGTIGAFGEAPGQLRSPSDLAIDPLNRLCVASPNNGRIERYGLDSFIHLSCSPAAGVVSTGTNLVFTAFSSGGGPYEFQWRKDGTNLVDGGSTSGTTSNTLTIGSIGTDAVGTYSLVLGGPSGTNIWTASPVAVLVPPAINTQPVGQMVAQGATVNFSVSATGDAISYQWSLDAFPIAGATNSSLQIVGAQSSDNGSYAVTVYNAVASLASEPAALTVIAPPVIVLNPASQKTVQGDTAFFDVVAGGDALAYHWLLDGSPVFTPNAAAIALANVQPPQSGNYSVIVTNIAGAVTSAVASLNVFIPPVNQSVIAASSQPDGDVLVEFLADVGFTYALDSSENLMEWMHQTNIAVTSSSFSIIDHAATNTSQRFYRLRWHP